MTATSSKAIYEGINMGDFRSAGSDPAIIKKKILIGTSNR